MEFIQPRFTGSIGISGSINLTGSLYGVVSGSLEGTASYAIKAGDSFPYSGSAQITGTLFVSDEFYLGEISGSSPFTASQVISSSAEYTKLSGSFSGSFYGDGSQLTGLVTVLNVSTSFSTSSIDLLSQSLSLTGSKFGIVTSGSGDSGSVVTFRLDDNVQISQSLYVTDNLYVSGTVDISKSVYLSDNLYVTGTSYFSGSLTASMIYMEQSASVSGTNIFGTASYSVTASYFEGYIDQGITLSFLTASTTWSAVHGLNTLFPMVTVWDSSSFEVIQPDVIESKGINTAEIRFTVPRTGYVNIARAGAPLYLNSPFYTASFALTASFISGGVDVQDSISASYAATASYILGGTLSASWASSSYLASLADTASVANVVTTISGSAPSGSAVSVGSLWYDNTDLTLYVRYQDPNGSQWWVPAFNGVLANTISASYSVSSGISQGFTSSFLSQSTVIVNHNLGTKALVVSVYDDLDYQVIPSSVQLSDNNNAIIQFYSVESGYVVIK